MPLPVLMPPTAAREGCLGFLFPYFAGLYDCGIAGVRGRTLAVSSRLSHGDLIRWEQFVSGPRGVPFPCSISNKNFELYVDFVQIENLDMNRIPRSEPSAVAHSGSSFVPHALIRLQSDFLACTSSEIAIYSSSFWRLFHFIRECRTAPRPSFVLPLRPIHDGRPPIRTRSFAAFLRGAAVYNSFEERVVAYFPRRDISRTVPPCRL